MKKLEKNDCILYLIESLQDFVEYKKYCKIKEQRLRQYKKVKPQETEDEHLIMAAEVLEMRYGSKNPRLMIDFEDIIKYMEDLPIECMEDGKSIQLMLYELVGGKCSEKDYKRIANAMKKKSRPRKVVNVRDGGTYAETINKQNNNYGRKRR